MGNSIKIFLGLALLFVLFSLLIKQCDSARNNDSRANTFHTERHDTIYVPGDTVLIVKYVPQPKQAGVMPAHSFDFAQDDSAQSACDSVRWYADSLRIDSTSIVYYSDTVLGKKLTYRLTYKGKPYVKIIKESIHDSTIYIEKSKIYTHGLYAIADVGGNLAQFNYSIGADYISKKKWSAGYRYGINQKTHNIKIGYKLF